MARNTSGLLRGGPRRQKGVPNKVTRDVRTLAQSIVEQPESLARLREQARKGTLHPAIFRELLHYAYGKPKTTIDLGDGALEVLRVVIDR